MPIGLWVSSIAVLREASDKLFFSAKCYMLAAGSSVEDHLLGSYWAAAVAVVQAQFTARRFEGGMRVRRGVWRQFKGFSADPSVLSLRKDLA